MHVILNVCVYCERDPDELMRDGLAASQDEALQYYKMGESQVLLCEECADEFAPESEFDLDEIANGPITFPPGVTAIEHTCPALEKKGEAPQWATYVLQMTRHGDYYVATCEHCGVTVRSLAEDAGFLTE